MRNRAGRIAALLLLCLLLCACGQEAPAPPPLPTPDSAEEAGCALRVSELMAKNRSSLADTDGSFPDWVELENAGTEALDLEGFTLSDRPEREGWRFPAFRLEAGGFLLIYCSEERTGFSLGEGDCLMLRSPDGTALEEIPISSARADRSLVRLEDGRFEETVWISPGYPNGAWGYECYCRSRVADGLAISEAAVANDTVPLGPDGALCDWVEIENRSGSALDTAGCSLSDSAEEPRRWLFPARTLAPGERLVLRCDADEASGDENTGFSLSAAGERLYLFDASGELLDYVWLHDLPAEASLGRRSGEGGFYYCTEPSPGGENGEGFARVAEAPRCLTADGVYEAVETLEVSLEAAGEIRYTLDGSLPGPNSSLYTAPLTLRRTCALRAVCYEDGALPSAPVSFSFFLNEGHSLPVLSLVTDDPQRFSEIYGGGIKDRELMANLSLYDGEHSFNHRCELSMKGWTSLSLPKKSMGVSFSGRCGGALRGDVFGDGITEHASLSLRAGQDYTNTIFRNELVQELCLEASDTLLTQQSKYCVLYINGRYYGIYCLKEDFSRQYYASHAGVSKHSVEMLRTPVRTTTDFFREVLVPAWNQDLSRDENYDPLCERLDIDSLIDWFIFEGWSANTDIQGNTRIFRSPENGGRWQFALYDLDWAFYYEGSDFTVILLEIGNAGNQMPPLLKSLLRHPDFRDRFLRRFGELNRTTLSNERVLEKIDELEARLEPEAARDRQRWGLSLDSWHSQVENLRGFITGLDWEAHNRMQLIRLLRISKEEQALYFGAE